MKFRDPKTGEVFEVKENKCSAKFCAGVYCSKCPIGEKSAGHCSDWVNANPTEAARLMGYEIIEEEPMEKPDKPRICEVLEASCENCVFESRRASEEPCVRCSEAYSSQFKSKPRFTEEEVAVLRYIDGAQKIKEVHRNECGTPEILFEAGGRWAFQADMFPSLLPGQSVKLEEVIGA